ncbi:hypothetical protein SteCoe_27799 [Stentor coeruleus]|uniref:Uncharacterized protein n=1 Tax=Stentor coeruleus TaxID=5963 RepID=A0A1R2B9Q9_9CILI|nr:hypothetical protein SteCoe_27799 [Stentor coeruleus]
MVEESSEIDYDLEKDPRNRRGGNKDAKKRFNKKEQSERKDQMKKRDDQRNGAGITAEEIKQEFDEVNQEYLKMLEKRKKAEENTKKAEEKKNLFEKDLIDHVVGPEPKNESKMKLYKVKVQNIDLNQNKKNVSSKTNSSQRAALLNFMKQSFK